jgi:hypothetical protein
MARTGVCHSHQASSPKNLIGTNHISKANWNIPKTFDVELSPDDYPLETSFSPRSGFFPALSTKDLRGTSASRYVSGSTKGIQIHRITRQDIQCVLCPWRTLFSPICIRRLIALGDEGRAITEKYGRGWIRGILSAEIRGCVPMTSGITILSGKDRQIWMRAGCFRMKGCRT